MINGILHYPYGELASLPRATAVVEDRYPQGVQARLGSAQPRSPTGSPSCRIAELQVRRPGVLIVFSETRQLAQEWTHRYLAADRAWVSTEARARPTRPRPVTTGGPARLGATPTRHGRLPTRAARKGILCGSLTILDAEAIGRIVLSQARP